MNKKKISKVSFREELWAVLRLSSREAGVKNTENKISNVSCCCCVCVDTWNVLLIGGSLYVESRICAGEPYWWLLLYCAWFLIDFSKKAEKKKTQKKVEFFLLENWGKTRNYCELKGFFNCFMRKKGELFDRR
jgi:hypothetical protein